MVPGNYYRICNGVDEDDDEGFVAMMESRSRAINMINDVRAAKDKKYGKS
jgi:hypothetical protein